MRGLAALLDSLRLGTIGSGSDADIHQIEGEGDKVQVLTMHVSKGLEFPIVFIAGGLTVRSDDGIQVYHRVDPNQPEKGCRKVIDLTAVTGREEAEKEVVDENKRLYYVALTRARLMLYIPYFPDSGNHRWIGPVSRFVSSSIQQGLLTANDSPLPVAWHQVTHKPVQTVDRVAGLNDSGQPRNLLPVGDLLPVQTDFRQRKISLESFSSIGHRLGQMSKVTSPPSVFSLTEAVGRDVDEPAEPASSLSIGPDPSDELPGGTRMGSMFHHIFEHIDFQAVTDGPADIMAVDSVQAVVASAMALYRIEPHWAPRIARIVAVTLRTPIQVDGAALVLGRLTLSQRRHELEFYFPFVERFPPGDRVPGCSLSEDACGEMVMRGFIDLIFTWRDRYYIADWKSNRLANGYDYAPMAAEIAAAGYDLQYRIYSIATLRWLTQRLGDRFDPQRHFGGVFYIFIRGAGTGGHGGVFHVTPEQLLPLESLQAAIHEQIAGLQW